MSAETSWDLTLPDTASWEYRRVVFVLSFHFGGAGICTITQTPVKGGAPELDVYGVEEIGPEHFGTRVFTWVNFRDPTQEQPYRTTVGRFNACTCEAGRKGKNRTSCKHRDALAALIVAGALPQPPTFGA